MSKKLGITLLIEAAVCFVVALSMSGAKAEWIAFPYAQIGTALRALSLSGAAGNLIAWAILILIACLPLGWLAFARVREKAPVRSTDKVSCCDDASDTDECDGATDNGECGATNACGCDGAANNDECGATNAHGCDDAANNDECDGATDTGECGATNVHGCDGAANNDECGTANACGCGGMTNNDESDSMNARSRDSAAVCGKSYRGIFRGRPENWLMVLLSGFLIPGIYGRRVFCGDGERMSECDSGCLHCPADTAADARRRSGASEGAERNADCRNDRAGCGGVSGCDGECAGWIPEYRGGEH